MARKYIPMVNDVSGGALQFMVVEQQTNGTYLILGIADQAGNLTSLTNTGALLSTQTVTDFTDKRFLTDAQQTALALMVPLAAVETQLLAVGGKQGCESLLASAAAVDLNTATATTLYTVATGKSCIITRVVIRLASTSLTTVSMCFGYTGAVYNDVILTATHTELTGNTLMTTLYPKVGALVGLSTNTFKELNTILQGGAATATFDVYGYLF